MEKLADIKVTVAPAARIMPDNKCGLCTSSICCTYVTQHIDAPRSKHDFEHLLWQVSHENVKAYKDEDGWFLLFETRCNHLTQQGLCGIYEHRPKICREYTNDYCEFDAPAEGGFDLYFPDYETLLRYCKKRFKRWNRG
jgi:Fe-S-cluster containining protein